MSAVYPEISRIAAPLIDAVWGKRARRLAARMASCHGGACAPRGAPHASHNPKETS